MKETKINQEKYDKAYSDVLSDIIFQLSESSDDKYIRLAKTQLLLYLYESACDVDTLDESCKVLSKHKPRNIHN